MNEKLRLLDVIKGILLSLFWLIAITDFVGKELHTYWRRPQKHIFS